MSSQTPISRFKSPNDGINKMFPIKMDESPNWMRHSIALGKLWAPPDRFDVCEQFGNSCGAMAFAAVTGTSISKALEVFQLSACKQWVNKREMCSALEQMGFTYTKASEGEWPQIGLSLIHFTGPWTNAGYPARILQNSHWIGVIGEYIFDINWRGWLPRQNWSDIVVEQLLRSKPKAEGWLLLSSYDILNLL